MEMHASRIETDVFIYIVVVESFSYDYSFLRLSVKEKAPPFCCALAEAAVRGADFHVTLRPRVSQSIPGNLNGV